MSWEMPKTDVQYDIFNISIEVCESPCSYITNEKTTTTQEWYHRFLVLPASSSPLFHQISELYAFTFSIMIS